MQEQDGKGRVPVGQSQVAGAQGGDTVEGQARKVCWVGSLGRCSLDWYEGGTPWWLVCQS
jgi:hypothetical protein